MGEQIENGVRIASIAASITNKNSKLDRVETKQKLFSQRKIK